MAVLPVDDRGYPVPWFVHWTPEGKPDFRIMDYKKRARAITEKLCWICGGKLGQFLAFVIGPMCAINRVSQEPPAHRDCALFSAKACPFLTRPHAKRREGGLPEEISIDGIAVMHNPGVALVWVTREFFCFSVPTPENPNGYLIKVGDPLEALWLSEGRQASRLEVLEAISRGLPILVEASKLQGAEARQALVLAIEQMRRILPPPLDGIEDPDLVESAIGKAAKAKA